MNQDIRSKLEQAGLPVPPKRQSKEEIMSTPTVGISAEQLQDILVQVLKAAKEMNPLDQKKFDEAMKAEQRRNDMTLALGQAEEASERAKKNSCSHCRWPANSGKRSGEAAPRGQGEWCTGGQRHGDMAGLVCSRCGTRWLWMATPAEREYIDQAGLMNFAPPPDERLLNPCPHCDAWVTQDHPENCHKKPVAV